MVHALQEGESSSESLNIIEKYYASKNQINSCEDNPVNQNAQYDSTIRPSAIRKQEMNTRKTDEEKRNSVLFPKMSQKEIDSIILDVCQKRY